MAVTPGLPQIGEQRFANYIVQKDVDVLLFHDGNQSGHVKKPIQAVDTTNDIVQVNDNIISNGATGSNTNQTVGPRGFQSGRYGFLTDGQAFDIAGSTGNNGTYTVADMQFNFQSGNTLIYVNESITDSTPDGNALFGNTNRNGRGDNLRNNDQLTDITSEPSNGGYTRATGQPLDKVTDGNNWIVTVSVDTVFDNLSNTTGRVDAVAVVDNWQAKNDSSATDHILFTSFLDQMYLLDNVTNQTLDANTIRLKLE